MKKFLLGSIAAVAFAGIAPALAQTGAPAPAPHADKVVSRADVQAKIAEHFAKVDTNRDGAVTKAEADAFHAQMRARFAEKRDERREHRFDQLDSNNDGAISRQEFDGQHAKRDGPRAEHGKGRRGMHGMHKMGGRMFEMADANKDARVTLQEANAAALQHFDMADANRDGQITRDERRQMHQRMRAEHVRR